MVSKSTVVIKSHCQLGLLPSTNVITSIVIHAITVLAPALAVSQVIDHVCQVRDYIGPYK